MVDAGVKLEPEKQLMLGDEKNMEFLRHTLSKRNAVKLSFGSDYPYRGGAAALNLDTDEGVACMPSLAQGGLSNVWGACIDSYGETDVRGWPVTISELSEGFVAADKMLNATPAKCSKQAQALMNRWKIYQLSLEESGFRFGKAKLAVNFSECTYCGECQHGCPYDLIYSARHTLGALLSHPNFTYQSDCVVVAVQEQGDAVLLCTHHHTNGLEQVIKGGRVFMACGALASTVLVMRAANFQSTLMMKDSAHFLQPCLMVDRVKGVASEKLHSLAQLVMKYQPSTDEHHPVNLQLYTYMNHYDEKLRSLFAFGYTALKPWINPLTDRLIALQCHLHSDDSHGFSVRIENQRTVLRTLFNLRTQQAFKRLRADLSRNASALGFHLIPFSSQESKISRAFHYGGALPMRRSPVSFESDILGRPFRFNRIHVVDASVLPSIAAGSITPTVMANAFRIATESGGL